MNNFIPVCEPALLGKESEYVNQALASGWISSAGEFVEKFEQAFAAYSGLSYGVSVCNGTAALHLALRSLAIGQGDEVIIPAFTMIATAFAVCYTGAVPVFVDAEPDTWNIDSTQIKTKITKRTKAIVPVHIMGLPCDMDAIASIVNEYGLFIIEDAAQAHGGEHKQRKVGSFSHISTFSFFANKNLTTGEGGMCLTNDPDLYERLRYYKNLCFPLSSTREYTHDEIGFNYRMSNIHAAIGLAQVEKADEYCSMRRKNAALYREYLSGILGLGFQADDNSEKVHAHWMNALSIEPKIFGESRDELMQALKAKQIESRKLFTGMHKQKSLSDFGCDCSGAYAISDFLGNNGLYLPSASTLSSIQIQRVCEAIRECCNS